MNTSCDPCTLTKDLLTIWGHPIEWKMGFLAIGQPYEGEKNDTLGPSPTRGGSS